MWSKENWESYICISLFLNFLNFYLFIYFLLYFTLQYCIGFAIHWHESTTGIHVFPILKPPPPPSPSHPSGSSQCTSPKHPVSCIELGLAIHFTCDNLHVSVPFSHIIPPSPSPTESKRLFYVLCFSVLFFLWYQVSSIMKTFLFQSDSKRNILPSS